MCNRHRNSLPRMNVSHLRCAAAIPARIRARCPAESLLAMSFFNMLRRAIFQDHLQSARWRHCWRAGLGMASAPRKACAWLYGRADSIGPPTNNFRQSIENRLWQAFQQAYADRDKTFSQIIETCFDARPFQDVDTDAIILCR